MTRVRRQTGLAIHTQIFSHDRATAVKKWRVGELLTSNREIRSLKRVSLSRNQSESRTLALVSLLH